MSNATTALALGISGATIGQLQELWNGENNKAVCIYNDLMLSPKKKLNVDSNIVGLYLNHCCSSFQSHLNCSKKKIKLLIGS